MLLLVSKRRLKAWVCGLDSFVAILLPSNLLHSIDLNIKERGLILDWASTWLNPASIVESFIRESSTLNGFFCISIASSAKLSYFSACYRLAESASLLDSCVPDRWHARMCCSFINDGLFWSFGRLTCAWATIIGSPISLELESLARSFIALYTSFCHACACLS